MTELIDLVQLHEPGSALVELYELQINDTDTVYFHPGLDSDLTTIFFEGNEYVALPAELTGVEYTSDGASTRPTLTVANLLGTFSGFLFDYWASPALELKNEDLIGRTITKRATLKKYLDGEPGGGTSPVIEFPKRKYIIDRISQETKDSVSFELAAPFDLAGVKLPGRNIVGKYCAWQYQGGSVDSGCPWKTSSTINYANGSGGVNSHKAYFTEDDIPLIPNPSTLTGDYIQYEVWAGTGVAGTYYEYDNGEYTTVWKCVRNTSYPPYKDSADWIRGDVCGKKLSSCKVRFQFKPATPGTPNSLPAEDGSELDLNTTKVLPFGAFPGSRKFR